MHVSVVYLPVSGACGMSVTPSLSHAYRHCLAPTVDKVYVKACLQYQPRSAGLAAVAGYLTGLFILCTNIH